MRCAQFQRFQVLLPATGKGLSVVFAADVAIFFQNVKESRFSLAVEPGYSIGYGMVWQALASAGACWWWWYSLIRVWLDTAQRWFVFVEDVSDPMSCGMIGVEAHRVMGATFQAPEMALVRVMSWKTKPTTKQFNALHYALQHHTAVRSLKLGEISKAAEKEARPSLPKICRWVFGCCCFVCVVVFALMDKHHQTRD